MPETRPVRYVGPSRKPVTIMETGQLVRHDDAPAGDGDVEVPAVADVPERLAERLVEQAAWAPDGWEPSGDVPPIEGSREDVLEWVDGDPQRAARAAEAERRRSGGPRKTLLPDLEDLAEQDDDQPGQPAAQQQQQQEE